MRLIDDAAIGRLVRAGDLVAPLRDAFARGARVPRRTQAQIDVPGGRPGVLLTMPAWTQGAWLGTKVVTVFPDNARLAIPTVGAVYVLMSATTGEIAAIVTGAAFTLNRTAAVSALASQILSRADARTLLLVGTGALVPYLAREHAAVRPLRAIWVWGRSSERAARIAEQIGRDSGIPVSVQVDLEQAVRAADIISTATMSTAPLIAGDWLRPGTHLDLVGSFQPAMREADTAALLRGRVFVDVWDALDEAGDLSEPIASGAFARGAVAGDLAALARDDVAGRSSANDITVFKSVGTALADLATAVFLVTRSVA